MNKRRAPVKNFFSLKGGAGILFAANKRKFWLFLIMTQYDNFWMRHLRACAICQVYFPPSHWLCSLCWEALEREYLSWESAGRAEKTLPHFRLFDWRKDNHRLMSRMADSLKQGGPYFIFRRMGLEMFSRFMPCDLWGRKSSPVFVPAPANSPHVEDHAFMLASALRFYFGGGLKNLLKKESSKGPPKTKVPA